MKTIQKMLKPRESVFSDTARDDVLNLTDFAEGRIDPEKFFSENFKTQGMTVLFDTALARFKGESETGVVKLTQAMGGGKTHSMLALALLAKHKEMRTSILGKQADGIGDITVIAFSGRNPPEFGIWGYIAEQLGKKEAFKDYYSPLKAPGESAWVELLKGENILILLDELPPYLENAKATAIGNSDLSVVTIAALSNLFSALGKESLANVCLVFSDLKAAYESGSELIESSFRELESEANRTAIDVTPVALNSDEIYSILTKRLFEDAGGFEFKQEVNEIAIAYKDSVSKSKKLGLTTYTPESVYQGIVDAYPFHPSIKDLYARFKENQNFQQTRGLIKLMRQIVRQFYETGKADEKFLINVFDFDLNEPKIMNHLRLIKPTLEEAINHDIAQEKKSIAESIDLDDNGEKPVAQEVAKLLLMSSLSTTNNGLLGLTESEVLGYLSTPTSDVDEIKRNLEKLIDLCWYIKVDNRGRLYFQNTKNMVAEMNTLVDSYSNENARKELKSTLEHSFSPKLKNCYQNLFVLTAVDEINLETDKIALVIYEPHNGNGLHPTLADYYENISQKNRVMFLSGQRNMMEKLYSNAKKLKAIEQILDNMDAEHISRTDQQYIEADKQKDKMQQALLSTIRETFVSLYYPTKSGMECVDLKLEFAGSKFDGEQQIVKLLTEQQKFEDFSNDDKFLENLRKKCEQRLFTVSQMIFSQIKERAAQTPAWQWYHPEQMDSLKKNAMDKDKWREIDNYIHKGPFKKDPTSVMVEQTHYDDMTQEFTLKVKGLHGKVYYDIGAIPTKASSEVVDSVFKTTETKLQFICIDSEGEHETGDVVTFTGKVPLKYDQRNTTSGQVFALQSHPKYEIKYTTDGSDPKENGGVYVDEFPVDSNSKFVRTAVYCNGDLIETKDFPVSHSKDGKKEQISIDKDKPLTYTYLKKREMGETETSFEELTSLTKLGDVLIQNADIDIYAKDDTNNYASFSSTTPCTAENLREIIALIRLRNFSDGEISLTFAYKTLVFAKGELFQRWLESNKFDLTDMERAGEIKQ